MKRYDEIDTNQAAELLGISPQRFTLYCRAGAYLTAYQLHGTRWRIERREIDWILEGRVEPNYRCADRKAKDNYK